MAQIQSNTLARPAGNGAAIVKPEPLKIIEAKRDALAAFLPDPKELDRFIRSAAFALARNPKLAECTRQSLQEAVCTAAELRLDFSRSLGLAYIVPYKDGPVVKAQFQIGYRGLVCLAGRSGVSIEAHCVHEGDRFEQHRGTERRLIHDPPPLGAARGEIIGAYALASFGDGRGQFDVMDMREIDAIRACSMADKYGADSPWKNPTFFPEMCKKTPTRRLCKYLNLNSAEMARALEVDNEDTDFGRGEQPERTSNTQRLGEVLGTSSTPNQPPPVGIGDERAQPPSEPVYEPAGEDIPFDSAPTAH